MTARVIDKEGMAINRLWKEQQAKIYAAQQNAVKDVRHDVTAAKKQPVIHPDTHKPTDETPAECKNCGVVKECKTILKMWYQRKPRPQLVQAWCGFIDRSAPDMICLSGIREGF